MRNALHPVTPLYDFFTRFVIIRSLAQAICSIHLVVTLYLLFANLISISPDLFYLYSIYCFFLDYMFKLYVNWHIMPQSAPKEILCTFCTWRIEILITQYFCDYVLAEMFSFFNCRLCCPEICDSVWKRR